MVVFHGDTLQGTNISPKNGIFKMIFLFPRWDMLIPWRVPSPWIPMEFYIFIGAPWWIDSTYICFFSLLDRSTNG